MLRAPVLNARLFVFNDLYIHCAYEGGIQVGDAVAADAAVITLQGVGGERLHGGAIVRARTFWRGRGLSRVRRPNCMLCDYQGSMCTAAPYAS